MSSFLGDFLEADLAEPTEDSLDGFKDSFLSFLSNPEDSGDAFSKAAGLEPKGSFAGDREGSGSGEAKRGPIKAHIIIQSHVFDPV